MKWSGRRKSDNVEVVKPKPRVSQVQAWMATQKPGHKPVRKPKASKIPLGEVDDLPEGSELRRVFELQAAVLDRMNEESRHQNWWDAKHSKRDSNYEHSNFRKGGKVCSSGKHVDYGK